MTLKSRSNLKWIIQLVHSCEIHLRCKFGDHRSVGCRDNAQISIFYDDLKTQWSRLGRSGFWVCDRGSLVGLCMQNYKSLCVVVMICAITLVNIQTDRHTHEIAFDQLIWKSLPAELTTVAVLSVSASCLGDLGSMSGSASQHVALFFHVHLLPFSCTSPSARPMTFSAKNSSSWNKNLARWGLMLKLQRQLLQPARRLHVLHLLSVSIWYTLILVCVLEVVLWSGHYLGCCWPNLMLRHTIMGAYCLQWEELGRVTPHNLLRFARASKRFQ